MGGAAARSAKKILCALCLPCNNDHCACKHKISQLLDDDLFNCFCLCQINYKCLQFFPLCQSATTWMCGSAVSIYYFMMYTQLAHHFEE